MIRQCQILPSQLPNEIEEQRQCASLSRTDDYFKAHNVKLDNRMVTEQAKVLFPPAIQYSGRYTIQPDQGGSIHFFILNYDLKNWIGVRQEEGLINALICVLWNGPAEQRLSSYNHQLAVIFVCMSLI
jgi:hypothetical protein